MVTIYEYGILVMPLKGQVGCRIITTPHFLSARVGSGKSERSSQMFLVIIVHSLLICIPKPAHTKAKVLLKMEQ